MSTIKRGIYAQVAYSINTLPWNCYGSKVVKPAKYAPGQTLLWLPVFIPRVHLPLYAEPCAAGFPLTCRRLCRKNLDLKEHCIPLARRHVLRTRQWQQHAGLWLYDGDVMVVDRAE